MPRLPEGRLPEVEKSKILECLLAFDHPQGGPKARFFAAFGFKREEWKRFAEALVQHGIDRELTSKRHNEHGVKYVITCTIKTPDGRDPCISSIWIAEGVAAPRLVTAYPAG